MAESQQVVGEIRLAPLTWRVAAVAIDGLLLIVLLLVVFLAGQAIPDFGVGGGSTAWLATLAGAILLFGYFQGVFVWLTGGASVGKAVFGLAVRDADGSPPAQELAELLRLIGRFSLGFSIFDVFGIGSLWALIDPRQRCPHDLVFRTQVVLAKHAEATIEGRLARLEEDRRAGLELVRERWSPLLRLFKWSSLTVATVMTVSVAIAKMFTSGATSSTAAGQQTTSLAAGGLSSTSAAAATAVVTTVITVAGVAWVVDSPDERVASLGLGERVERVMEGAFAVDRFTLEEAAGSAIAIDVHGNGDDCNMDLEMVLLAPDGELLYEDILGNQGCFLHGPFDLSSGGTSELVFRTRGGQSGYEVLSGPYALTLLPAG